MNGWLELEEKRSLFLASLRVGTLYSLGALVLLLFLKAPPANAQQITRVPPFVGTHSETWERFGFGHIPNGTSILGGIATISGSDIETAPSFQMCSVRGRPSDGTTLMDSDRPSGPLTITFSQPVSTFGAYWGSGVNCFGDPPSILTFQDVAGNIIGTDSFVYEGDGTLAWHGYQFGTPVKTITRRAGDGHEGVAVDGLQAIVGAVASPPAVLDDFNNDGHPDYLVFNPATRATFIWYMNNNVHVSGNSGPTLPGGWNVAGVADFNGDGHPDYLLFNPATRATVIWYMNNNVHVSGNSGPTLPGGWNVVGVADFNRDGHPDYLLFNANSRATVIWYMNNNVHVSGNSGPTLPGGWNVAGVADFNGDDHPDYLLFNVNTHATVIWYMNNNIHVSGNTGPTLPQDWDVAGAADFDGNGRPDYLLYKSSTRQTLIWYMNNNVRIGSASGPTLPAGWSLVAP
jgi:elongation factor P hydroxylase